MAWWWACMHMQMDVHRQEHRCTLHSKVLLCAVLLKSLFRHHLLFSFTYLGCFHRNNLWVMPQTFKMTYKSTSYKCLQVHLRVISAVMGAWYYRGRLRVQVISGQILSPGYSDYFYKGSYIVKLNNVVLSLTLPPMLLLPRTKGSRQGNKRKIFQEKLFFSFTLTVGKFFATENPVRTKADVIYQLSSRKLHCRMAHRAAQCGLQISLWQGLWHLSFPLCV